MFSNEIFIKDCSKTRLVQSLRLNLPISSSIRSASRSLSTRSLLLTSIMAENVCFKILINREVKIVYSTLVVASLSQAEILK